MDVELGPNDLRGSRLGAHANGQSGKGDQDRAQARESTHGAILSPQQGGRNPRSRTPLDRRVALPPSVRISDWGGFRDREHRLGQRSGRLGQGAGGGYVRAHQVGLSALVHADRRVGIALSGQPGESGDEVDAFAATAPARPKPFGGERLPPMQPPMDLESAGVAANGAVERARTHDRQLKGRIDPARRPPEILDQDQERDLPGRAGVAGVRAVGTATAGAWRRWNRRDEAGHRLSGRSCLPQSTPCMPCRRGLRPARRHGRSEGLRSHT
jgi:hypothetical protein